MKAEEAVESVIAAALALARGQESGQIAIPRKEKEMNEAKLGWFDRLLLKIAIAKAAARGENPDTVAGLLMSGIAQINAASSRTS